MLGAVFAWYALELRRTLERAAAVRLFHYSLLYLALLFVAMALDPVALMAEPLPEPEPPETFVDPAAPSGSSRGRTCVWGWALVRALPACCSRARSLIALAYLWLD